MTSPTTIGDARKVLTAWFDENRPSSGEAPRTYVICAGLAILEHMRDTYPLVRQNYVTPKNQVRRLSGAFIRDILARHGETRQYTKEGGRTTRGTVPAARALVKQLHESNLLTDLSNAQREEVIDQLQEWLVAQVRDYFNRQRLAIEVNLSQPASRIVEGILEAASVKAGAVAQHLVGAKLAVRFPDQQIENHSHTTADRQLGRPGDFVVGDTVFHVTMAPMPSVLEKCQANLRDEFRPLLLVPDRRLQAARQLAETIEVEASVGITALETFVGQNLDEISEFKRGTLASGFRTLLETYNTRVQEAESDRSLLIEIPSNL